MATQKFMGRGQLVNRLAAQVGSKELAISLLKKRGHMNAKGELTAEGRRRNEMTAAERAKDRLSRRTGTPVSKLGYNPRTNTAIKR